MTEKALTVSFLSGLKYEHFVAGLTAGLVPTLITHPLDLIKLRFAVHDGQATPGRPQYRGLIHAMRSIVKEGGMLALYRGASANMVGAGASWGIYFFIYNALKFHIQGGDLNKQLSAPVHLLLASLGGMVTMTFVNPVWVVKTRLCLSNTDAVPDHRRYRGLIDGLTNLYKYEGLRGCYKGYLAGLVGTSHGAVQFMAYEEMKKLYCNLYSLPISTKLGPIEYITMAASSKLVATCVTYPYQVIRARLQDQHERYTGTLDVIRKVYRNESMSGFYKGLTANIVKVVPATSLTFVVYEYLSHLLLKTR
ncbi:hypothetical protein EMCRGX_G014363 [Ephydatia muelleri]